MGPISLQPDLCSETGSACRVWTLCRRGGPVVIRTAESLPSNIGKFGRRGRSKVAVLVGPVLPLFGIPIERLADTAKEGKEILLTM